MIKLVSFEDPIFETIQGEGNLVGTPSVFVRFHGCDFSCDWCDTKDSWRPGSKFMSLPEEEVLTRIRKARYGHAVITGGNPLLQVDSLCYLLAGLHEQWLDRDLGDHWRSGMHTTVETQASIFDGTVAQLADMMSLSPKLHDWREDVVQDYLDIAARHQKSLQIKVVCWDEGTTLTAILRLNLLFERWMKLGGDVSRLHLVLQPEYSSGRYGMRSVISALDGHLRQTTAGFQYPNIRVIGQTHKNSLFVR